MACLQRVPAAPCLRKRPLYTTNNTQQMKNLYRFLLAAAMLTLCGSASCQSVTALPEPMFRWRCSSGDTVFNHNPAVHAAGPLVFDSLPYVGEYTVVAVYKALADTEAVVWRMTYPDSSVRSLTTERILSDSVSVRYAGHTDGIPAVSTLRQTAPRCPVCDSGGVAYVSLAVGGGETKVAEVSYYAGRLGNAVLRRIQTAAALRYGITLGPVDYLDGSGRKVWSHASNRACHHRITGIGAETLTGLYQTRSRSEVDGAVLTMSTDSLADGEYLVAGDDDGPLSFGTLYDTLFGLSYSVLGRSWKAQFTSMEERPVRLVFDTRSLAAPADSLVLLLDGMPVLPTFAGGDSVVFGAVVFPTDSSRFTLGRGRALWQLAQVHAKRGGSNGTDNREALDGVTARIYPNPSLGSYTLEVEGASWVQVTIYNALGSAVDSFGSDSPGPHRFTGSLPTGSVYYATVTTDSGSQTIKLVVK